MKLKPIFLPLAVLGFLVLAGYLLYVAPSSSSIVVAKDLQEIPCDQSMWESRSDFDRDAWVSGKDREKFTKHLRATLPGKSREEVETLLGKPANDLKAEPNYYRYLLGKHDYLRCHTALATWFLVYFDKDSKVASVSVQRVH